MILNQFQSWARTAPPQGRADGIRALTRAYLYSTLDEHQRADALRVMTSFLDDPSTQVRRALAETLADAVEAPHHLVLALADDCATVSAIVLARSPLLSDAELIDCASTAHPEAQAAIAARHDLPSVVASALAEIAAPEALVALAGNNTVALPEIALRRMVERHGAEAALREALLARGDLPPAIRVDLVTATADVLAHLVTGRAWLSAERMKRLTGEAADRAAVTIAGTDNDTRAALVAHLRRSGRLTPSFAFRAILSGKIELFKAILVELSGVSAARVDAVSRSPESKAFSSLYGKCGMPPALLPAFRLALAAARDADWLRGQDGLSLDAVTRVLTGCVTMNDGDFDTLLVLLRRFEAEASREDARVAAALTPPLGRSRGEEPLLLADIDDDGSRQVVSTRRRNPFFAIDMAAIEAELVLAA